MKAEEGIAAFLTLQFVADSPITLFACQEMRAPYAHEME
jgi:hypothetical protein